MKIGLIAASVGSKIFRALLTERVIINVVIVLGDWLVKRTSNDLDDKVFKVFKDAVDKRNGQPANLYNEVR